MLRLSEKGEILTSSYKFCAVFESEMMFMVRTETQKIGEIQVAPKEGVDL